MQKRLTFFSAKILANMHHIKWTKFLKYFNYYNIISFEQLGPGWLTLILLFTTNSTFANSVDPDQMASEEVIWSGSTLFVIQFVNLKEIVIWCNLIGW